MSETTWSLVLLGLRITVCAALYLFLVAAFRTLRAELRHVPSRVAASDESPANVDTAVPVMVGAAMTSVAEPVSLPVASRAVTGPAAPLALDESNGAPATGPAPARELPRRRIPAVERRVAPTPLRNALIVMVPLLVLGGTAIVAGSQRVGQQD